LIFPKSFTEKEIIFMDDFEIELKRDFLQEASELMQSTEQSFLELEKDPSNKTLIDAIFRFAHNLKGTSRAVGFGQIAELTHSAENLLLEIKQEKIFANDRVVSTLLVFNDKVREMIDGLKENLDATFECADLIKDLDSIINGELPADMIPAEASLEAPSADAFEEATLVAEATEVVEHIEAQNDNVRKLPEKKVEVKKAPRQEDETIRVSLNRLEVLNNLVGELVILQSVVESSLSKTGEIKTARSLGKLCKDIQDLSMSLRMVPVGPSFQKLTRIVRDTSKLLNKKVDLKLLGEDTEIDKTVAESIGDPLVHIIRNAIDHGVETPEERVAAGKPEEGIVEVMAFHEGNFLVIQITDDGKGINGAKLIEKAKAKGIIPQNAALSEQQAVELIFHAGFSTKDTVSEVSGRGVGMDVVKTNIEALGGEVKVRSKVGSGSCFRLMLPLTLAIIDGMLIKAGGQMLIVPKGQVLEVIKLEPSQVTKMTGRRPYLTLRDQIIPVFNLEEDWGSLNKDEKVEIAMIIRHNENLFAVGITDIIRQQQVVVKPPTKEIMNKQGVMGTTILGDGKPSLIIDLINLYSKRLRQEMKIDTSSAAA
jgi:two-component system chemotaxis sensor kinase CheA